MALLDKIKKNNNKVRQQLKSNKVNKEQNTDKTTSGKTTGSSSANKGNNLLNKISNNNKIVGQVKQINSQINNPISKESIKDRNWYQSEIDRLNQENIKIENENKEKISGYGTGSLFGNPLSEYIASGVSVQTRQAKNKKLIKEYEKEIKLIDAANAISKLNMTEEEERHWTNPDYVETLVNPVTGKATEEYHKLFDELKGKGLTDDEAKKAIYHFGEQANNLRYQMTQNSAKVDHRMDSGLGNFLDQVATGIAGTVESGIDMLGSLFREGEEVIPKQTGDKYHDLKEATYSEETKDMNPVSETLYSAALSMADMGTSYLLTGGASKGMSIIMGSSAGTSSYNSALKNGATEEEAFRVGVLSGTAETLFEKLSIERLFNVGKNAKSLSQVIKNVFTQAGFEGSEEVNTEIANAISQQMILGEKSDYSLMYQDLINSGYSEAEAKKEVAKNFGIQLAKSFAGGAVAGGAMSGGVSGVNYMANRQNNVDAEGNLEETGTKSTGTISELANDQVQEDMAQDESVDNDVEVIPEEQTLEETDELYKIAQEIQEEKNKEKIELFSQEDSIPVEINENTETVEKIDTDIKIEQPSKIETKSDTKSVLPDAVKLSEEDVVNTVENGSYHPMYELGTSITTERGTGYIQEIVSTTQDSRKAIINYDDGTSEVMILDNENDVIDSMEEGLLFSHATNMGYHGANTLIVNANEDVVGSVSNINTYVRNAKQMYNAGLNKTESFNDAYRNSGISLTMPEVMANKFYQAGVIDRKNNNALEMSKTAKKKVNQNRKDTNDVKDVSKYKEINIQDVSDRLDDGQKKEISVIEKISEATGITVKFFESKTGANGKLEGANGFFKSKENEIWIDINAGRTVAEVGRTAMAKTMSHELTHYIKKWSAKQYSDLENRVLEILEEQTGKTREQLIKDKMQQLGVSEEVAAEEIVADGCEMMLKDSNAIQELAKENQTLYEKIKEWINDFVNSIKEAFGGLQATSEEAKALVNYAEEIQQLWNKALVNAVETNKISDNSENDSYNLKQGRSSDTILYSFGGRNSQTADLQELKRAEQLEKEGKSFKEIFRETGWYRGIDNIWKYEIDDSKMEFDSRGRLRLKENKDYQRYVELSDKFLSGENLTQEERDEYSALFKVVHTIAFFKDSGKRLADYVKHDELYEAYPSLRNMNVKFIDLGLGERGMFNLLENTIYLNKINNDKTNKKTIMHEIQHAIQEYENFTGGSSVLYWDQDSTIVNEENSVEYQKYNKEFENIISTAPKEFLEKAEAVQKSLVKAQMTGKETDYAEHVKLETELFEDSNYGELYAKLENTLFMMESTRYDIMQMSPEELYKETAGEIEARDTANRLDYSKEQRKQTMPDMGSTKTVIVNSNEYTYSMDESFEEQVEKVRNNKWSGLNALYVGETSQILLDVGLDQLPMLYTKKHLEEAVKPKNDKKHQHGLTYEQIKEMPNIIKEPAIILDSLSRNDSIVMISDILDNMGQPILVSIKINGSGMYNLKKVDSNFITSMYGRKGIEGFINEVVKKDAILYISNKKSHNLFSLAKVQFPRSLNKYDFDTIIRQSNNIVNKNVKNANTRFSMRNVSSEDYEQVIEENKELKKQVELLESQFKVTNGHAPKMVDILKIGQKIIKKYSSSYDLKTFGSNMEEIVEQTRNSKFQNYSAVMNAMMKMSRQIAEQSEYKDTSMYNQYAELRKSLRTTRITFNQEQREAAAQMYDSYENFRKKNMGKLRLANNGISLDEMWQQYAEMYPELFSKETNVADQVSELLDIIEDIRSPKIINLGEMDIEYAAADIAQEIFSEYFALPSVQTFADARINDLKKAREEYNENLKMARQDYKDKYDKKTYRDKIVRLRNNLAAKVTQKKNVPFGMVDKVIDVCNEIYRGNMNLGNVERKTRAELEKIGLSEQQAKKIADKCSLVFIEDNTESVGRSEMRLEKWLTEQKIQTVEMRHIMNTVHDNYFAVAAVNKTEKNLHARLKGLQQTYSNFRDSEYEWKSEYDERLDSKLKEIAEVTEDKALNSLDNWQLEKLYSALKEVSHIVINATNQIADEKGRSNLEMGDSIINRLGPKKNRNGLQKIAYKVNNYARKYTLNSIRYVRAITEYDKNHPLWILFEKMFNASRIEEKFKMDSKKPFDELLDNSKEYNKFIGKSKNSLIKDAIYDKNGKPITISHNQLVQIIMSWERKQGRYHMEHGGLTIYDAEAILKGNLEEAKDNSKRTVSVTDKGIERLKEHLTEYDKKWIKAAHHQFNKVSQEVTNEVSMELNGVPLAIAKDYIRLYVDDNFVTTESAALKVDATLEGQGRLKSTTNNAPQPLRIIGIEKVVNDNINETGKYYAYAIPIKNLRKAINVTLPGGEQSVKKALQDAYGTRTVERLEKIIDEVETGRAMNVGTDDFQKDFGKLYSNWVSATLNGSISVVIKNFGSYPNALAYIDMKNLTKALVGKVSIDEIDKYTGAHYKRRQGLSHMELEMIKNNSTIEKLFERLPKKWQKLSPRKWMVAAECFTTARIWKAAKYQINDEIRNTEIEKGSQEYWNKVTELYHKVCENTQPMYDVQYRAGIQKSNNTMARVLSMFKTDALQTYGMVYDSLGETIEAKKRYNKSKSEVDKKTYETAKKRMILKSIPALISTSVFMVFLTLLGNLAKNKTYSWRDDETGELVIEEKLLEMLGGIIAGNIMPIGGNELYSMAMGDFYDLEEPTLAMMNDAYKSLNSLFLYAKEIAEEGKEFSVKEFVSKVEVNAYDVAKMFGLEAENIIDIFKSATYYTGVALGNKQIKNALGYQYKNSQLYASYYNAIVSGDDAKAENVKTQMVEKGITYSSIDSGIKKLLKSQDTRVYDAAVAFEEGDYDKYENLVDSIVDDGFKNDVVIGAVKSLVNDLFGEETEKENKDEDNTEGMYTKTDLYNAILESDQEGYTQIREYLNTNGYNDDELDSSIKSSLKKSIEEGVHTQAQAETILNEYLGYDDYNTYITVNSWNGKDNYSDLNEGILSGNRKELKYYMELLYNKGKGKSIQSIKTGISSGLKGQYIYEYMTGGNYNTIKGNVLYAMDYMGVNTDDYSETIDKWIYSADCYSDMIDYIADGNVSAAQNEIYDLYYNQDKEKDTILRSIESTYKPLLVYMKEQNMNTSTLEESMIALAVYLGKNKTEYKNKISSWD